MYMNTLFQMFIKSHKQNMPFKHHKFIIHWHNYDFHARATGLYQPSYIDI